MRGRGVAAGKRRCYRRKAWESSTAQEREVYVRGLVVCQKKGREGVSSHWENGRDRSRGELPDGGRGVLLQHPTKKILGGGLSGCKKREICHHL